MQEFAGPEDTSLEVPGEENLTADMSSDEEQQVMEHVAVLESSGKQPRSEQYLGGAQGNRSHEKTYPRDSEMELAQMSAEYKPIRSLTKRNLPQMGQGYGATRSTKSIGERLHSQA